VNDKVTGSRKKAGVAYYTPAFASQKISQDRQQVPSHKSKQVDPECQSHVLLLHQSLIKNTAFPHTRYTVTLSYENAHRNFYEFVNDLLYIVVC
jgi:hypothetical protein